MLRRSLTPDRPLALLQRHVRAPFAQLPLALVGDVEAVHQLRVAGRRLRVALPILAANPESRAVRRALRVLRQLIRAAGPTRDRDVSFLILQECPPSLAKPGGAFPILRRRLRQGLQRSRAGLVTAMLDLDISGLRRDLRGALAAGSADLPTAQRRSDEAARPLGQALFQGFGTLGGRYDAQSLHRLRRALEPLMVIRNTGWNEMGDRRCGPR